MIIKKNSDTFQPCPEFTGRAVCVDVTPLKKVASQYGEREVFRFVFEIDMENDQKHDGSRFCVWSSGYTPGLHEKSNLRKFLRGWLGRDFTTEELNQGFDAESMLGKPAFLVVTHTDKDGTVYANIASCTPDKSGTPLAPSGKFKRACDRDNQTTTNNATYKRVEQPPQTEQATSTDWAATKVHVGKFKGIELRDLSPDQIKPLVDKWLPDVIKQPKLTADDKRLIAALESYTDAEQKDDLPY